jgi:hypothetical protein
MNDRSGILEKYAGRNGDGVAERDQEEAEVTDDLVSFGWLPGIRDRALSLELRKKTGNIVAIGYSYIEKQEFDPSEGITLHALGQKIRIKGRNLNAEVRPSMRLFEGICRHKIPFVREADEPAEMRADGNATVVEQIECE